MGVGEGEEEEGRIGWQESAGQASTALGGAEAEEGGVNCKVGWAIKNSCVLVKGNGFIVLAFSPLLTLTHR